LRPAALLRRCRVLDAVQQGKTAPLDVLRLNSDIFFTNYYGLGSDAAVARDINAFRQKYAGKRREALLHGRVLYFLAGLRRLGHRLRAPVEISYEDAQGRQSGQTAAPDCRQIVVTNIASYAGGAQPSSQCRMDDGLFEVTVVGSARQWMLLHLTRFFKTPIDRVLPGIIRFQARSLTLGWSGRLCCQVDGETFGAQEPAPPHTITVAGRVEVIVP